MQADRKQVMRLLKTARGQIDGIIKMVEEDRYCIDITHQLMATQALLRKVNKEILAAHMTHCLKGTNSNEKMDEMVKVIDELLK